ncbi:helix-turn-helix domain-containing protein [Ancylobacter defluvii]|uniref:Chromosomal replication initiator DnaA C-terminal domain-containing protein n=1 Tax=Ancylobacter defluvii TaxID=1282440 RepID=A0A9W6NBN6_9HYPH|nr:helix-turn-helix domain-containing protein [Ancylobacter defluvii]MBS7586438.1 hypothetical protein [Ancylobacter defluvii]GLK85719.1 hypothetical protein GCM10017653_37890 [Ancylobacter defluvii]
MTEISVREIISVVADHFGVAAAEIVSQRMHRQVLWPRVAVVGLAARLTPYTLTHIGRALGNRDPSTICSSRQKFVARLSSDPAAAREIEAIETALLQRSTGRNGEHQAVTELAALEREIASRATEARRAQALAEAGERRLATVRNAHAIVATARRLASVERAARDGMPAAMRKRDAAMAELLRLAGDAHV